MGVKGTAWNGREMSSSAALNSPTWADKGPRSLRLTLLPGGLLYQSSS